MLYTQKTLLKIGKNGCYFLSVGHLAGYIRQMLPEWDERNLIFLMFKDAVSKGWCDENCYMLRPDELLEVLIADGGNVSVKVRHESADYVKKDNEYEILRYELPGGGGHFICGEDNYDPLGLTEKERGKLVSKRIFTVRFS